MAGENKKKSSLEVTQVNLILESEHEASLLWGTKAGKQAEQALCSPAVTTKAEASAVLQKADQHLASLPRTQSFQLTWQLQQLAVEALPEFAL